MQIIFFASGTIQFGKGWSFSKDTLVPVLEHLLFIAD
jgi:hypothetical protein